MRKMVKILIVIFILCSCHSRPTNINVHVKENFKIGGNVKIIILPIYSLNNWTNKPMGPDYDLTNLMTMSMMKLGFQVVDRMKVDSMIDYSNTQAPDSLSKDELKKIVDYLGVDLVMFGTCLQDRGTYANVNIKLIDARSGDIVYLATINYPDDKVENIIYKTMKDNSKK